MIRGRLRPPAALRRARRRPDRLEPIRRRRPEDPLHPDLAPRRFARGRAPSRRPRAARHRRHLRPARRRRQRPTHERLRLPDHAADALAVLDATGIRARPCVTASRGLCATVLLATEHPERVERIAVVAPYMDLEPDPSPPDPAWLEELRTDWRGFIDPFMHNVFTEPGSDEVIAEMIGIGMDASPDAVATGELEVDWTGPARGLARGRVPGPRHPRRGGSAGARRACRGDRCGVA